MYALFLYFYRAKKCPKIDKYHVCHCVTLSLILTFRGQVKYFFCWDLSDLTRADEEVKSNLFVGIKAQNLQNPPPWDLSKSSSVLLLLPFLSLVHRVEGGGFFAPLRRTKSAPDRDNTARYLTECWNIITLNSSLCTMYDILFPCNTECWSWSKCNPCIND